MRRERERESVCVNVCLCFSSVLLVQWVKEDWGNETVATKSANQNQPNAITTKSINMRKVLFVCAVPKRKVIGAIQTSLRKKKTKEKKKNSSDTRHTKLPAFPCRGCLHCVVRFFVAVGPFFVCDFLHLLVCAGLCRFVLVCACCEFGILFLAILPHKQTDKNRARFVFVCLSVCFTRHTTKQQTENEKADIPPCLFSLVSSKTTWAQPERTRNATRTKQTKTKTKKNR